jgi:Domain of unknown function (DUF4260)
MEHLPTEGVVTRMPRALLRIEGAVLLVLALYLYAEYGSSWWLFVALVLAPDLGMLGYLAGERIGAMTYNLAHTYLGPGIVLIVGLVVGDAEVYSIAVIWFAHIGVDRALGYGLKYEDGFAHTHLGLIGRREP